MQSSCVTKTGLPDLKETYGYKDTQPFGGSVAYQLIKNSFDTNSIVVKSKPLYESIGWSSDTASLYINISRKFFIDENDASALMDFVYKGNSAFIAASEIDTTLLDKLYCKEQFIREPAQFIPLLYTDTKVSLVEGITSVSDSVFQYFYLPFSNYFSEVNNTYGRIVGYNQTQQPNFIVFFWGKGRMYLHCDPRSFSNYFLLQKNNFQYLMQPLQVLPDKPEHIFWDNYYNRHNYKNSGGSTSSFDAIFKNPPLKWAFLILLLLLGLFIFFNGKRKQRIVPVVQPLKNSSVAFAEAIAGLYLKEKDNKIIADKMIAYFNEYIRSHYFLNTGAVNNDFYLSLSRKAAVPLDKTEILYSTIQQLGSTSQVSDVQLINLNEQIQQFIKYKN